MEAEVNSDRAYENVHLSRISLAGLWATGPRISINLLHDDFNKRYGVTIHIFRYLHHDMTQNTESKVN